MNAKQSERFIVISVEGDRGVFALLFSRSFQSLLGDFPHLWQGSTLKAAEEFVRTAMLGATNSHFYILDAHSGQVFPYQSGDPPSDAVPSASRLPSIILTLIISAIGLLITPRPLEVIPSVVFQLPAGVHILLSQRARWNAFESIIPPVCIFFVILMIYRGPR